MTKNKTLQKLLEQQARITEQIKIEREKDEKKRRATHNLQCQIVGSAIYEELKENKSLENQLKPIIEKHVKTKKDRELLGLSVMKK